MRQTEVCNTQTEGNLRFLRGGKSYIQLATSSPIDTGACQGISPVAGLAVAPRPGNEPPRSFQGQAAGSGSRFKSRCSQTQQDGCDPEALGGDPGAHHELGAVALTLVEAVRRGRSLGPGSLWIPLDSRESCEGTFPSSFPDCCRH